MSYFKLASIDAARWAKFLASVDVKIGLPPIPASSLIEDATRLVAAAKLLRAAHGHLYPTDDYNTSATTAPARHLRVVRSHLYPLHVSEHED